MKQAFLDRFMVSCKSSLLDCFVIDVAIILFNRKGLVTFTWWNLFCLVKRNIYFFLIFLFTYFPYAYIFCTASAFPGTAEHTTMRFMWLFCDPRVDVLGQRGAFFSHDFGLPRTGSSSAVHSGNLDFLHSSPSTSSSLVWALGLRWNGPKPLGPFGPTLTLSTLKT